MHCNSKGVFRQCLFSCILRHVARGRLGHTAPHASKYKMRNVVQEHAIKYLFDSTSVLNKMKSLRSHFHSEQSKVLIKKSESSTAEICKSSWFVYKHLLYILENDDAREGKDTIITLEESLVSLYPLPPPDGATARGGPWPPLQCASKPLDSLLCLSIHLNPSSSGPWTHHTATSFLVFLFVLLHTAFRTSFLELRCLAFFLCDLATIFFGI